MQSFLSKEVKIILNSHLIFRCSQQWKTLDSQDEEETFRHCKQLGVSWFRFHEN